MPTCPDGHQSSSADFCDTCGMRIEGAPAAAPVASGGGAAAPAGSTSSSDEACPVCGNDRNGLFCEVCGYDFTTGTPAAPVDPANLFGAGDPGQPASQPDPARPDPAQPDPAQPDPAQPDLGQAGIGGPLGAAGPIGVEPVTSPQRSPGTAAPDPAETGAANGWAAVVTADREYFDSVVEAGGPDAASIDFPAYIPERRFTLAGKEMRIGRRSTSRGLEPEIDLSGPPMDPGVSHLHAVLISQPDGTWSVLDPGSSNGTQVNGNDLVNGVPYPLRSGDKVCLGAWTVLLIEAP
jgi:FHA domain